MHDSTASLHSLHKRFGVLRWVVALFTITLAAGTLIADEVAEQASAREKEEEFLRGAEVFTEIFHEIQEKYVEDIGSTELMEAAIRGMFAALDPHSQYMGPDTFSQLTQSTTGEFFGIGIHIGQRDGWLTVIAPIPNTPSARLGIQPWDRIMEIQDDETEEWVTTEDMPLQEAVQRLKGPEGTQVKVRIFRAAEEAGQEGQILEFTITRARIEIESVFSTVLEDNIGYLRIAQFSEETSNELRRALRSVVEQGVEGLILDLRWNSGGLLSQAIDVSDLFLPKGALAVSTQGKEASSRREYHCQQEAFTDLPMITLVNRGSASASEIVAGALQDHRRSVIFAPDAGQEGNYTFGKASVQTIEEIQHVLDYDDEGNPRPTAIRITTAHYYTPNDRDIHDVGIIPDIHMKLPRGNEAEVFRRGRLGEPDMIEPDEHRDAVRSGMLENGNSGSSQNGNSEGESVDESPEDSVIEIDPFAEPEEDDEAFRDVLLEAAVRHLEVYLRLNGEDS
jgi:carboxyl-terminal processing protease